jgi:hypothetical protein
MKEIARIVGCSLSSVSLWTRGIQLTDEQCSRLNSRNPSINGQLVARANEERARARRVAYQQQGRRLARAGDCLHESGCMLYWAEGSKSRNAAQFVNSDPEMVTFFVEFLRTCYAVSDAAVRLSCNLFADHAERQREIEQFWLDTLELPSSCLLKSTVNVYSKYSQKKRKNRLPYGTVRICVHSTELVQSIYGAIQEYGSFERPEWLG